jgi:hypothetical protein
MNASNLGYLKLLPMPRTPPLKLSTMRGILSFVDTDTDAGWGKGVGLSNSLEGRFHRAPSLQRFTRSSTIEENKLIPSDSKGHSTMLGLLFGMCFILGAVGLATPADNCSLAILQGAVANYLAAQSSGSSSVLTALSSSTTYTQNDKSADVKTGILASALQISHNRTTFDTTQCATYTE